MLVLLGQILGLVAAILSSVQAVLGIVGTTAQETQKFILQNIATAAANTVNSPTYGNAALLAAIADVKAEVISSATSITLQIVDLTDGTTPVSLPVAAPSGYGGLSYSDTGDAVWNYSAQFAGFAAHNYLTIAGDAGAYLANWWENDNIGRYFQPVFLHIHYTFVVSDDLPVFDPTDILSTEDLKTCLIRQNPGWTIDWTYAPQGTCYLVGSFGADQEDWVTTIDGTDFNLIKAQIFPTTQLNTAPVWPGLAGVTLGAPSAISSSGSVAGPMDGVIVEITGISTNKPALGYGPETAYKFIGALAFVSDNGDVETFQPLSFQNAVYSPRFLKSADSLVFHIDPSVSGTITPWVVA